MDRRTWPASLPSAVALELNLARIRVGVAVLLVAGEFSAAGGSAADAVTLVYAAFAAVVLVGVSRRSPGVPSFGRVVSLVDLVAAVCLTVLGTMPTVHFFPLFVLVSTAYRAGVAQTIASGAVLACALALETHPAIGSLFGSQGESHLLVLGGYTLVAATLIGHLAQRERGARSESAGIGRLFERLRLNAGPVASLRTALEEFQAIFGARQVLLAVDDTGDDMTVLWRTRVSGRAEGPGRVVERLGAVGRSRYWFPVGTFSGACLLARAGGALRVAAAVDDTGGEVSLPSLRVGEFAEAEPASRVFVLSQLAIGRFRLRLFVLDPSVERADEELRLLQTLAHRIAPVVHNLYLERQLRTRLKEDERARLARELHDGVIQSLIGIEMRLEVARRRIRSAPAEAAEDLGETQRDLREQIVDVRTLMNQLRPPDVDHRHLIQRLSETAERFHKATGIQVRFDRGVDRLDLPARVCGELVRVVDEALANVRKHSGARHVAVSLDTAPDGLTLSIEDDGRGFDFAGRLTQPDLDALGLGPLVIKQRVHALGGRVAIDSVPGRGTRLEVQVPTPALG